MAEIKNTFLKSKMNKDLDDRILPNGEYRDANNISVGRSEDSDVGALENVIGNSLITATNIGPANLSIIGTHVSDVNNIILVFLTTYVDSNIDSPTFSPDTETHYICSYNSSTQAYTVLVSGTFLNFSKTNRIIGINLIENLLFWTDNRNQPRKINIDLAVSEGPSPKGTERSSVPQPPYYTKEHQISVAKYNPYQTINLYKEVTLVSSGGTSQYFTVTGDRVSELTPFIGASVTSQAIPFITGDQYIFVADVYLVASNTRIAFTLPASGNIVSGNTMVLMLSSMTNENSDNTWPGDPNYLEDKFVRFSYRFQFDDNEYSIMAPFTQIAYIPTQKGYFVAGDEEAAYQSTIVNFMTNNVQNIELRVPLPDVGNRISSSYKISNIELLFRESDSIAVKVLESIPVSKVSIASPNSAEYVYDYQSRKPYKTLPEVQTTRVYDKVPVKAFAQESAGNRIIYGNFADKYTPPNTIDYNCSIADKSGGGVFSNYIEYPNHSVKKNRNYQVGFVLADKFGRKSPVILSGVNNGAIVGGDFYSGSTIYSPYDSSSSDIASWFGEAIQIAINSPINSPINSGLGTPGLYAIAQQNDTDGSGFAVKDDVSNVITGAGNPNSSGTWVFTLDSAAFPNNANVPIVDDYLRGKYVDFVKVINVVEPTFGTTYTITTDGTVNDVYAVVPNLPVVTGDIKFAYRLNEKGWYSYNVVVKQTQQEYYNAYLPGILNGYPGQSNLTPSDAGDRGAFPFDEVNLTAHAVLLNDNINKIPRDLQDVGPTQAQFRSSVTLYGRVENTMEGSGGDAFPQNTQYFPRIPSTKNAVTHTVNTIATARDLDMSFDELSDSTIQSADPSADPPVYALPGAGGVDGDKVFYQIDSNPLIARISTLEKSIGVVATGIGNSDPPAALNMLPYLAVYETKPVESLLDIYWEATSEGLISDLNADILTGYEGAIGLTGIGWDFPESKESGDSVTDWINAVNLEGGNILTAEYSMSVTNAAGDNADSVFSLELGGDGTAGPTGAFQISVVDALVFDQLSFDEDYWFFDITVSVPNTGGAIVTNMQFGGEQYGEGALINVSPSFDFIDPYSITPETLIVLEAPLTQGLDPKNGTGAVGEGDNQIGRRYEFIGGPLNANGDPGWTIDPDTGQIEQELNNVLATGTWEIRYSLWDALQAEDKEAIEFSQQVFITIGATGVNPGVLTDPCVVNIIEGGNVVAPNDEDSNVRSNKMIITPSFPADQFERYVSGCWYIAAGADLLDSDLPLQWREPTMESEPSPFPQPSYTMGIVETEKMETNAQPNNVLAAYRIGQDAHRGGTINFTINASQQQQGYTGAQNTKFYFRSIRIYKRFVGEGPDDWQNVYAKNEKNRQDPENYGIDMQWWEWNDDHSGFEEWWWDGYTSLPNRGYLPQSGYPASVQYSYAEGTIDTVVTKQVETKDNINSWYQAIRAYDFEDQQVNEGDATALEWCIIVDKFFTATSENMNLYRANRPYLWVQVDDLNFPSCVILPKENGEGINIMDHPPYSDGQNYFRYDASIPQENPSAEHVRTPTGSALETALDPPVNNVPLYSTTPYPEYVDRFYLDQTFNNPWIPPLNEDGTVAKPFLNFALTTEVYGSDQQIPESQYRWKNDEGKNLYPKWIAKFDAGGYKYRPLDTNTSFFGLSAIPCIESYSTMWGSNGELLVNTDALGGSWNNPPKLIANPPPFNGYIYGPPLAGEQQPYYQWTSTTVPLAIPPVDDGILLNNQSFTRMYRNLDTTP